MRQRWGMLGLVVAAALLASDAAAEVDATARELIAGTIKASGGEARLRKIREAWARYELRLTAAGQDLRGTAEVFQLVPGKVRNQMKFGGIEQVVVITEKEAWTQVGASVTDLPSELATDSRRSGVGAIVGALGVLDVMDRKLQVAGRRGAREVGGKKVDVLEVTDTDGSKSSLFLDPTTRLVVGGDSKDSKVTIRGYRLVEGVQVASIIRIEGPQSVDMKLLDARLSKVGIKPALFARPAAR